MEFLLLLLLLLRKWSYSRCLVDSDDESWGGGSIFIPLPLACARAN
jgi:hypothetical protein